MYSIGYFIPLDGQDKLVRYCLGKHNIIVQGPSSTGKTSFCIASLLQKINLNINECQGLILGPTREIIVQIESLLKDFSSETKSLNLSSVEATKEDFKNWQIIIATPREALKIMKKNLVATNKLKFIMLDRFNEIISTGFKDEIIQIYEIVDEKVQVIVTSDKMSTDVEDFTKFLRRKPNFVSVKRNVYCLEDIAQYSIKFDNEEEKLKKLISLFEKLKDNQAVIYCNSKKTVFFLSKVFAEKNFNVSAMHGDLDQSRRSNIMRNFRTGVTKVIIGTDLMAGRADAQHVSVLINYDLPQNRECYVHRISRDQRFRGKNIAISFVCKDNYKTLKNIEAFYNIRIVEMPMETADLMKI